MYQRREKKRTRARTRISQFNEEHNDFDRMKIYTAKMARGMRVAKRSALVGRCHAHKHIMNGVENEVENANEREIE